MKVEHKEKKVEGDFKDWEEVVEKEEEHENSTEIEVAECAVVKQVVAGIVDIFVKLEGRENTFSAKKN